MPHSNDIAADLWSFSLERYARASIGEICLDLQDRFGADVNVVLLCLWAGQRGTVLTGADLSAILADGAAAWHRDAVTPLRTARRNIKTWNEKRDDPAIEAFRDKVKALELEAERHAQRLLTATFAARAAGTTHLAASPAECAMRNVATYLQSVAPAAAAHWRPHAEALVANCID